MLGLGTGSPPVFLWGPPGSGKTHLMRALARHWQQAGAQVGWYDADTPSRGSCPPIRACCCSTTPSASIRASSMRPSRSSSRRRRSDWRSSRPAPRRRWTWTCARTCARGWAGARPSRCSRCPSPRCAPCCAARPTAAASR
ncbi:hypothetical protein [Roseateles chitinivorans]|uniref:hypothetical protein n=1 Tax=Roseateles chitinivorans TaxID=2917965 RepID=UPI003D66C7BA